MFWINLNGFHSTAFLCLFHYRADRNIIISFLVISIS